MLAPHHQRKLKPNQDETIHLHIFSSTPAKSSRQVLTRCLGFCLFNRHFALCLFPKHKKKRKKDRTADEITGLKLCVKVLAGSYAGSGALGGGGGESTSLSDIVLGARAKLESSSLITAFLFGELFFPQSSNSSLLSDRLYFTEAGALRNREGGEFRNTLICRNILNKQDLEMTVEDRNSLCCRQLEIRVNTDHILGAIGI